MIARWVLATTLAFAWSCAMTRPIGDAVPAQKVLHSLYPGDATMRWNAINDVVMGGRSSGRGQVTDDGYLRFTGNVSLENNGGFASIRSEQVDTDLSAYDGVMIRVRGDGKRYALTLRTDVFIRAGGYRIKFDTEAGLWRDVYLPFDDFQATSFGIALPDAPPLDPGKISSIGLIIGDKQEGPFSLDLDWIRAVRRMPAS